MSNLAQKSVAQKPNPPSPNPSIASLSALPIGTKLQEYEITGVLGEGGFGIVYLAHDKQLDREIAIKEYMPASLASRGPNGAVVVRSGHHGATFQAGRQSFITEAKLLAKFKHSALVEIFRFWEENGTAYMAMPFYRGQTLKQYLRDKAFVVDERWLRAFLAPLLDALEHLHEIHCYHRDISPDNILILENGQPLLLDFGAARRIIGDLTQALTVILKPGYAPVEQYADDSTIKQGPWTDIYGMAAVCFFAIKRAAPPAAVTRMMRDPMVALEKQAPEGFSSAFLVAIDGALKVKPEERPQSVQVFREMLGLTTYHADTRTLSPGGSGTSPQSTLLAEAIEPPGTTVRVTERRRASDAQPLAPDVAKTHPAPAADLFDDDGPTLILSSTNNLRSVSKATAAPSPVPTPIPTAAPTRAPPQPPTLAATQPPTAAPAATLAPVAIAAIATPTATPAKSEPPSATQMPAPLPTTAPEPARVAKTELTASKVVNLQPIKKPLSKGLIGAIGAVVIAVALWALNTGGKPDIKESNANPVVPTAPEAKSVPKTDEVRTIANSGITPIAPVLDIASQTTPTAIFAADSKSVAVVPPLDLMASKPPDPNVVFGPEIDKATEERLRIEKEAADRLAATIGFVKLDIQPWGNVVVNGARRAISPPVKRLSLPAGEYAIEITNPGFPSHSARVNVTAKETAVVTHRFQ